MNKRNEWIHGPASTATGGCIEVMILDDESAKLRDSKDPQKREIPVSAHDYKAFLTDAKNGAFDL